MNRTHLVRSASMFGRNWGSAGTASCLPRTVSYEVPSSGGAKAIVRSAGLTPSNRIEIPGIRKFAGRCSQLFCEAAIELDRFQGGQPTAPVFTIAR